MTTKSQNPKDVTRAWYILDASQTPIGRLATQAASLLVGKHKPTYTPHVDDGDYVVVINSDKLVVTGDKEKSRKYYSHSGHPGALKERTLGEQLEKDSTVAVRKAVRGMISANKLRDGRLARLKVFTDSEHAHTAQNPVEYKENK